MKSPQQQQQQEKSKVDVENSKHKHCRRLSSASSNNMIPVAGTPKVKSWWFYLAACFYMIGYAGMNTALLVFLVPLQISRMVGEENKAATYSVVGGLVSIPGVIMPMLIGYIS